MRQEFTIYSRKGYSVTPLIRGYVVRGPGGVICPFQSNEVDEAIDLVDELATGICEKVA